MKLFGTFAVFAAVAAQGKDFVTTGIRGPYQMNEDP